MAQLRGEVELVTAPHPIVDGVLHIRCLDVSRADAAATVVAERSMPHTTAERVGDRISFTLDIPDLDPRQTYTLEAHLDADGSGETSVGDYRTMEHIAVDSSTIGTRLSVPLRPVI